MQSNNRLHSPISLWLLLLFVLFNSCDETGGSQPSATLEPADLLPASGEISGWEKGSGAGDYGEADDQSSLYNLIDGAAELYIKHGFVQGVMQKYLGTIGGNAANLDLFISDQGDLGGAEGLFEEEQVVPQNLPPWEAGDEAAVDENPLFQTIVYVRKERFFIRVTADKNDDNLTALLTAQAFAEAVLSEIEN